MSRPPLRSFLLASSFARRLRRGHPAISALSASRIEVRAAPHRRAIKQGRREVLSESRMGDWISLAIVSLDEHEATELVLKPIEVLASRALVYAARISLDRTQM